MAPNYLKYMYKTLKIIKKRQQLSGNEWFDVLNGGKHIITHLESAPHYISHGDTHLENLVNIEVNFNNEPELAKVGIVDFGHAKLVTASYDLAILLEQDGFGFNYEDKNKLAAYRLHGQP